MVLILSFWNAVDADVPHVLHVAVTVIVIVETIAERTGEMTGEMTGIDVIAIKYIGAALAAPYCHTKRASGFTVSGFNHWLFLFKTASEQ